MATKVFTVEESEDGNMTVAMVIPREDKAEVVSVESNGDDNYTVFDDDSGDVTEYESKHEAIGAAVTLLCEKAED